MGHWFYGAEAAWDTGPPSQVGLPLLWGASPMGHRLYGALPHGSQALWGTILLGLWLYGALPHGSQALWGTTLWVTVSTAHCTMGPRLYGALPHGS